MKLFTNGCSWTWGAEIINRELGWSPGENIPESYEDFRLNNIWSFHLHKKLKTDQLYNLSFGSSSNQRIVRTTIDFFVDRINKKLSIDNFIAIIQWTEPSRCEIFDNEYNDYIFVTPNSCTISGVIPGSIDHVSAERSKFLSQRFKEHPINYQNEFKQHLICLSNFFNQYNIKYLFCVMDYKHDKVFGNVSYPYECNNNFFEEKINWLGHDNESNQILNSLDFRYPQFHPNLEGHKIISERIYNRLTELYNI